MIVANEPGSCVVEAGSVSKNEWSALSERFADRCIYQTNDYAEVRAEELGADNERVVVRFGDAVLGLAQVRIKRLPMVRAGVAYIYRGPLWRRRGARPENLGRVLDALREHYCNRAGLEVRAAPGIFDDHDEKACRAAVAAAGFAPRSQDAVDRTILIDLTPQLDVLRKGLAQKWRNGLNQAERRELAVETRTDDEAMGIFRELYDEMRAAKQFETGVSVASFARIQSRLPEAQKLSVSLAFHGGDAVAGHVSSCLGDTCVYLLGASNDEGRKRKASYLLQWRTIETAKRRGAVRYDLGGIDAAANPGVYHFKSGMGGRECDFPRTFAAPARGSGRLLVPLAEKAYRMLTARRTRGTGPPD